MVGALWTELYIAANLNNLLQFLSKCIAFAIYNTTRKYPLRGYFLGVLTHTLLGINSREVTKL